MGSYLFVGIIKVTPFEEEINSQKDLFFQSQVHLLLKSQFNSSLISYAHLIIE